MAIELNSNLSFSGNGFLDFRQGKANSTNDLLSWDFINTPIPLGFEACINGTWYIYNTEWNKTTGYFKKRETLSNFIPGEFSGSLIIGETIGEVDE